MRLRREHLQAVGEDCRLWRCTADVFGKHDGLCIDKLAILTLDGRIIPLL